MTNDTAAWFAKGAVVGVVGSPILAGLSALVFRFPVPFAGYMSGLEAVVPAVIGSLFYGLALGGFAVQAVLGGIGGLTGAREAWPNRARMQRQCVTYALLGASIGVLSLALLDKIIGPW